MANLSLSMALSHYDQHIPLFDGSVRVESAEVRVLEVEQSSPLKHGQDRHERMLQKGEFDICELSLSNYLIAKSRGMPFTAIPVFPRRLFSLSQMWVNTSAGIDSPQDLIGKKVGLSTFQTTLSVLAKGDLQTEYNVPWRKLDWYISKDELRGGGSIRRLFADPKAEETQYFRKNGYFPIMHVVAFKDDVLAKNPN